MDDILPEYEFKSSKTNINYFSNDKDSNISIVFIHGWQSFWESWNIFGIMDNFSKFNVNAIDLPGHNKSGHIEKYNLETYSAPVYEFIENLKNEKIILVGHSLGASIALNIASRFGDKISHAVLEDPPWFSVERGDILKNEKFNHITERQVKKYYSGSHFISKHKPLWKTPLDAIFSYQYFDKEAFEINPYFASLRACAAYQHDIKIWQNPSENLDWIWQDVPELSKKVKSKLCIIGGNNDKGSLILDEIANQAVKNIKNCEFHKLDTGHNVRLEDTNNFMRIVKKFIN